MSGESSLQFQGTCGTEEKHTPRRKPMPVNDGVENWFKSGDGRYFSKQCARLLAGVVTKETSVPEVSSKASTDHSEAREQNVVSRSPRKSATVDVKCRSTH